MKYLIGGIIIVVLVIAGFWAYAKFRKGKPTPTPTPSGSYSPTPSPTATATTLPTPTPTSSTRLGNHVGETLPDFRLQSLGRGSVSLGQYRGIDVVIELWDSKCSSCINGFNDILANQQRNGDRMVTFLINRGESEAVVRQHMQMFFGTRVMILIDPSDATHRLLGSDKLPYHVLISPDGVIRDLR